VSNIQPADATVTEGNAIDVSADITNTGDQEGTQTITLTIGGFSDTQTETLAGGASTTTTFQNVDTGALGPGSYTHQIASANDSDSGTLTVEAQQTPPNFQVSNVQPADATVTNGTVINLAADIENTGTGSGTQDITLTIGGFSDTQTKTLAGGARTTVNFVNIGTGALGPGSYTPQIASANDSASGSLTVEASATFDLEFGEQGIKNGTITVKNVSSGGVKAAVLVTYEDAGAGETGLVAAGQTVATFDGEDVQVELNDTSDLGANYTAHILPANELGGGTEAGSPISSETANAVETSAEAYISVEVIDGELARDTTGDGLLNNVRGADGFNILDVQALFNGLRSPDVQNNIQLFNFQDNDQEINILDVQGLFNRLSV
jgi:hypothetical protein